MQDPAAGCCAPYDDAPRILSTMPAALRFLWNATRGHHLAPWRSPYVRWRIETYSGMKAETLTAGQVLAFAWQERGPLFRFLRWTGEIERAKVSKGQSHD